MSDPRIELVRVGYDAIADRFTDRQHLIGDRRDWWTQELAWVLCRR